MQINPDQVKPYEFFYYVAEIRSVDGKRIIGYPLSPYFTERWEAEAARGPLVKKGHAACYVVTSIGPG